MGLTRNQCQIPPKLGTYSNTQTAPRTQPKSSNSGVVPMEVDNTMAQTNFKKLTPEEWVQLAKEGCCFCCHLQGHMACDCPKNANQNSNAHETTTTPQKSESPPKNSNNSVTPPTKLTRAQQIRALEEAMEDEEHATYLDSGDMGVDFWSALAWRSTAPQQS